MATPHDNSFTADTVAVRLARLQAIESNRVQSLALLPRLHPSVIAWMPSCYTQYRALLNNASVEDGNSQSGTSALQLATEQLHQELLYAKEYILSHYHNDKVRRDAFAIEGELSSDVRDMMNLADKIITVTALHQSQEVDYTLHPVQIARITAAVEAVNTALHNRSGIDAGADTSHSAEHQRFLSDIALLRMLLADWHSELGGEDERIGLIGMVNPRKGGNPGKPGAPSIVIDPHNLALVITPNANRPTPTSYQTEFREVGTEEPWEEFANSSENRVPTAVALLNAGTDYEFRTRARNSHGYGEWSGIVVRVG